MAYLAAGLTDAELRERFNREAPSLRSDAEVAARFGKPRPTTACGAAPYSFLEPGDSYRAARAYREIKHIDWVDQSGREYAIVDRGQRRVAYVRLPIARTRQERRENVHAFERQDFPKPGESIELTPARRGGAPVSATVLGLPSRKTATAVVLFDRDLHETDGGGDHDEEEKEANPIADARVQQEVDRRLQRLKDEAAQLGLPEGALPPLRPRSTSPRSPRTLAAFSAPKAPRAPKLN